MKKTRSVLFVGLILLVGVCMAGSLGAMQPIASPVTAKAEGTISSDLSGEIINLSENQCLEYVKSSGVEIPQEFSGQPDIGNFVKSVIETCVANPNVSFHYNYSVTQKFVQDIKSLINKHYIPKDSNQVLVASAPSYTLQDSTVYSDTNVEYYNCYAYSIGRTEYPNEYDTAFQYQPGDFSNSEFNINMSISTIAQIVKADLNGLGYYDIIVSAFKPEIDSKAKLICVRKGSYDYHFMKYDSGDWYHKPGRSAILKYKYEPDHAVWTNESYHNGIVYSPSITYDSEIYYIRYYDEKPAYRELFAGGTGTLSDPFLISNAEQFANIGLAYTSVYIPRQGMENRITYAFKLTNSITIPGDWVPFAYRFAGDFDGDGYYISYSMNLSQGDINENQRQGLFGFVLGGGRIYDLELMNCTITSDVNTELSVGDQFVDIGILAGSMYEAGIISNVTVTNPKIECKISNASIGALAGSIFATSVTNCVVREFNGTASITNNTHGYLGGMAGLGDISRFSGGSVTIKLTNEVFSEENNDMMGKVVGNSGDTVPSNMTANVTMDQGGECIAAGTLITLADGSQVPVEQLTGNEMLLVWNMQTGQFDSAPILFIDSDPAMTYRVIQLSFSDGSIVEVIYEHGFWDCDLNQYVYLDENAEQYIGHWFNKQIVTDEGTLTTYAVQLTGVSITNKTTTAYSPVTYGHLCYYVNGMLSMPGGIVGLFNIFEVDADTMKYDEAQMQADIAQYGLFTYEEFAALFPVSEEVFEAFNGQYLKVAMGKGLIDAEGLQTLIERYAEFLSVI